MKTIGVVLVIDGPPSEASVAISQAITSATMAARDDDAILAACADVPDEAIGWRGGSPGAVWEPVRRAIAAKRGLPTRAEDDTEARE
jgi:hypothetical protein